MIEIVIPVLLILLSIYAIILLLPGLYFTFRNQKIKNQFEPKTFISILIPVRNEAENISACLESILQNDYPKNLIEIIVIDDHSTDPSKSISNKIAQENGGIVVLVNNSIGKKGALTTGVHFAKGELIMTTDGDCLLPKNWISEFAEIYESEKPVFIAGAVDYKNDKFFFRNLLEIEQVVLQIISGGTMMLGFPTMCSGANMAYTKKFFLECGGYENDDFASGDDMMLMLKAKKMYPRKLVFNKAKNSVVKTNSALNFSEAIQQRSRWLSKFSAYKSFFITLMGLVVMLLNLSILVLAIVSFSDFLFIPPLILAFGGKMLVDVLLLSLAVPFFREPKLLLLAPIGAIFYPILAISSIVASVSGRYIWKGRKWSNRTPLEKT